MKLIKFTKSGIYCVPGKFYIDPWKPVEYAIITHAHSDHARWGSSHYLCHTFSKPVLQHRLGSDIAVETMDYGQTRDINGVKVSLHPAGHIIGSAQVRLEYKGFVSVISGDYKLEDDGLSTPFEPVRCHEFVTESTFGLPIYNWLPGQELFAAMKNWVAYNQMNQRTSIFVAYSLGKSQRLMRALEGLAPLYVHNSIANTNSAIARAGIVLPSYKILHEEQDKELIKNSIVIVPPALVGTTVIKKIPNGAIAICSGWMQVRGSRRWQAADAGFAVSDHADWKGLLEAVKATGAEKVYVTHGYQSVFSKYLNELGIDASEVSTQYGDDEAQQDVLKEEGVKG